MLELSAIGCYAAHVQPSRIQRLGEGAAQLSSNATRTCFSHHYNSTPTLWDRLFQSLCIHHTIAASCGPF